MVHPALLNADIVSIISESLDKESLSVLARTARFLQDPALRELWRDIEGLSHLLSPFGSSIKKEIKICFCNDPTSTQWDRFRFYAQFVRTLEITYGEAIEPASLRILSHYQPLLPRLKSLEILGPLGDQAISTLSMFFVPSLQTFGVDYCNDFLALDSLILTLGTTAPALRDLRLLGSQLPADQLATSISSFHNLCSIDIPLTGVDVHPILSHLSAIPSLSKMQFHINGLARISGAKYPFLAAKELEIGSESEDQLTYFLALTCFDNLVDLSISCENNFNDDDSLCTAISVSCGQSLENIKIGDGRKDPKSMKFSTIDPLSKFTNLRSFTFAVEETLWPADEDILDIAKAWPNLEEFSVDPYFGDDEDAWNYPLTLTGLLLLIEKCPNLAEISVPVNAMHVPNATHSISRPRLVIDIKSCYSPVDDPKSLADFLNLALPDTTIVMYEEDEDENYHLWENTITFRRYFIKGWDKRDKYAMEQILELQVALDESRLENARLRALQK